MQLHNDLHGSTSNNNTRKKTISCIQKEWSHTILATSMVELCARYQHMNGPNKQGLGLRIYAFQYGTNM